MYFHHSSQVRGTVLISGTTSGIGRAAAIHFNTHGWRVIATGRRQDRLASLQAELGSDRLLTRCFDVRNAAEVEQAIYTLPEDWKVIDVLINNAGLARGLDDVSSGELSDWDEMIDTNLKGLLYLSRTVVSGMIERKQGHIINIGSTAGKEVYLKGNVYCATKHAVDALTRGMRMDWIAYGIKVSALHPGYVQTEFSEVRFHGDRQQAAAVYEGFKPLDPEDVADVLLYMAQAPPHVNLADVLLLCSAQASAMITYRESRSGGMLNHQDSDPQSKEND